MSTALPRDESGFAALLERHRAELRVHCYRMLGSFEDAEDLVQETFLRAWRARAGFGADGRFSVRAWLYRIATNACLDVLRGRPRRMLEAPGPPADPDAPVGSARRPALDPALSRPAARAAEEDDPGAAVVARETIELAFLAAIQHLPPRQRAVLILRDVLDWPAKDTAALLDASVASVNSALQRARATLREQLPERRSEWGAATGPSAEESELLRRYVDAHERADVDGLAELLRADARLAMPPHPDLVRRPRRDRDGLGEGLRPGLRPPARGGDRRQPAARSGLVPAGAGRARPTCRSPSTCCGSRRGWSRR